MRDDARTSLRRPGPATPAPTRRGGHAGERRIWQEAGREVRSRWDVLAVIAAGGALGSIARWGVTAALPQAHGTFPWAIFLVNVTGCLLIGGLMVAWAEVWPPSRYLRPFLGIGVLGGYTTFSSYLLGVRTLLVGGHPGLALAYLSGSLAAGLAAVWAGMAALRFAIRVTHRAARRKAEP